jgi:hypothetical protein
MKRKVVIGLDCESGKDSELFRKFVCRWNEQNESLYTNGALVTELDSPVERKFSAAVKAFNASEGSTLSITRRVDVAFEKSDLGKAEWLRLCINGFAGAGSRELAKDIYVETKCSRCGYRDGIRQVRPLVVAKRQLKKKDFQQTSHLETLISDAARDFLRDRCGDEIAVAPVEAAEAKADRQPLRGYSQLTCAIRGGKFSPSMNLDLGRACSLCGREESRTSGGNPLVVDRATLPGASIFSLDEGLGSSINVPPRSHPLVVSRELFRVLQARRFTGFYFQPLILG